ncbi:MAG: LysE family transporter [Bacteroidales bacterium]
MNYILHLFLGLVAGILVTIPLGPVNLLVVNTMIDKNFRAAMLLASAASIMELLKPLLAIYFSWLITRHIESNMYIQLTVILAFVLIGLYFMLKKNTSHETENNRREMPEFIKGVLISFLNIPALPFWIFIVAYCESTVGFDFSISTVGLFLAGVFSGRYGTLWMYARLSQYVSERSSVIELWLDRVIAALFLVLALIQSLRILVHYG